MMELMCSDVIRGITAPFQSDRKYSPLGGKKHISVLLRFNALFIPAK